MNSGDVGSKMLKKDRISTVLLAGIASIVGGFAAFAQTSGGNGNRGDEQSAKSIQSAPSQSGVQPARSPSPLIATQKSQRAENFYRSVWGIENLDVREAASGSLLRFSFFVTDAGRAKALNDEKITPYLVDEKTGAVLQVPSMPKVGMLRQTADPANGKEYWMIFSNKRNFVKPGSRVDIVIGNFRAKGLLVR
jgi:hypothetical protein